MPTIRKLRGNWQCMIRVINHPNLSRTFKKHEDAKRWGNETELEIRREDAGIVKIKFPPFKDISLRYLNEVSIHKKCHRDERYTINSLNNEAWSEYPINKITPFFNYKLLLIIPLILKFIIFGHSAITINYFF